MYVCMYIYVRRYSSIDMHIAAGSRDTQTDTVVVGEFLQAFADCGRQAVGIAHAAAEVALCEGNLANVAAVVHTLPEQCVQQQRCWAVQYVLMHKKTQCHLATHSGAQ